MAESLTGLSPADTRESLLRVGSGNTGITSTLTPIADGKGQESIIQVSTTECNIGNGQLSITNNSLNIGNLLYYSDFKNVKSYGAVGDGITDDTLAIQNALDSEKYVFFPLGTYLISDTLYIKKDGQVITGLSKEDSIIYNSSNNKTILSLGKSPDSVGYRAQYCSISNLHIKGNALSTCGITLLGLTDSVSGVSRNCHLQDITITYIGAGFALRVNSWCNRFENLRIFNNYQGIELRTGANACQFDNAYISNNTHEAIYCSNTSYCSNILFNNATVQYNGGTNGSIDLQGSRNITFITSYLEGCTAPNNIYITSGCYSPYFSNLFHNKTAFGTCDRVILADGVKNLRVDGIYNAGGALESLVKLTGTLPLSVISNLYVGAGSVSISNLDDQSTRRATLRLDGINSEITPTVIRGLTSQNLLEFRDSDDNQLRGFFKNGAFYWGDVDTDPNITSAGSTLQIRSGTSAGNIALGTIRFDLVDNVKAQAGTGSPELALTVDTGSIFLRKDGSLSNTLYVKEANDGSSSGWSHVITADNTNNIYLGDSSTLVFGDDKLTDPNIFRAGSTLQFKNGEVAGNIAVGTIRMDLTDNIKIQAGDGSPEGVYATDTGTLFLRKDGSNNNTLYIKEASDGLSTGYSKVLAIPLTATEFILPINLKLTDKSIFFNNSLIDLIKFNTGSPESSLTATSGFYADYTNQKYYTKRSGTNTNTGWLEIPSLASSLTSGSILFADSSGYISQLNASLFFNNSTIRLGIGTNSPTGTIDANGAISSGAGSVGSPALRNRADTNTGIYYPNADILAVSTGGANRAIFDSNGIQTTSALAFYLGDPATDGTWRIIRSGNNLVFERRETGSYVVKSTISA